MDVWLVTDTAGQVLASSHALDHLPANRPLQFTSPPPTTLAALVQPVECSVASLPQSSIKQLHLESLVRLIGPNAINIPALAREPANLIPETATTILRLAADQESKSALQCALYRELTRPDPTQDSSHCRQTSARIRLNKRVVGCASLCPSSSLGTPSAITRSADVTTALPASSSPSPSPIRLRQCANNGSIIADVVVRRLDELGLLFVTMHSASDVPEHARIGEKPIYQVLHELERLSFRSGPPYTQSCILLLTRDFLALYAFPWSSFQTLTGQYGNHPPAVGHHMRQPQQLTKPMHAVDLLYHEDSKPFIRDVFRLSLRHSHRRRARGVIRLRNSLWGYIWAQFMLLITPTMIVLVLHPVNAHHAQVAAAYQFEEELLPEAHDFAVVSPGVLQSPVTAAHNAAPQMTSSQEGSAPGPAWPLSGLGAIPALPNEMPASILSLRGVTRNITPEEADLSQPATPRENPADVLVPLALRLQHQQEQHQQHWQQQQHELPGPDDREISAPPPHHMTPSVRCESSDGHEGSVISVGDAAGEGQDDATLHRQRNGDPAVADTLDELMAAKKGPDRHAEPKKCSSCGVTDSVEWRRGPTGGRELCNACGLRFYRKQTKLGVVNPRRRKSKKQRERGVASSSSILESVSSESKQQQQPPPPQLPSFSTNKLRDEYIHVIPTDLPFQAGGRGEELGRATYSGEDLHSSEFASAIPELATAHDALPANHRLLADPGGGDASSRVDVAGLHDPPSQPQGSQRVPYLSPEYFAHAPPGGGLSGSTCSMANAAPPQAFSMHYAMHEQPPRSSAHASGLNPDFSQYASFSGSAMLLEGGSIPPPVLKGHAEYSMTAVATTGAAMQSMHSSPIAFPTDQPTHLAAAAAAAAPLALYTAAAGSMPPGAIDGAPTGAHDGAATAAFAGWPPFVESTMHGQQQPSVTSSLMSLSGPGYPSRSAHQSVATTITLVEHTSTSPTSIPGHNIGWDVTSQSMPPSSYLPPQ